MGTKHTKALKKQKHFLGSKNSKRLERAVQRGVGESVGASKRDAGGAGKGRIPYAITHTHSHTHSCLLPSTESGKRYIIFF